MNVNMSKKISARQINLLAILLILFIISNVVFQFVVKTKLDKSVKKDEYKISELEKAVTDLETIVLAQQERNTTLEEVVSEARERAERLSEEFDDVNDNVEELEKITKTDPELLQKYSKVFFLNEHYAPEDLKTIPSKWTYDENRKYEIHARVYPFLKDLLEDAEDDGLDLQILSAFRSFDTQAQLKGAYTVQYGSGANTFSADQGYSEHQLGTTVDFTNPEVAATWSGFAQSKEYKWLQDNAHKYGFTLSYPENNQYYEFEPWHWRFVGEDLADDLHDDGEFFYDLSQREIDSYIAELFD
jgi:D-alanyl-D-alanine carboxypeptidase